MMMLMLSVMNTMGLFCRFDKQWTVVRINITHTHTRAHVCTDRFHPLRLEGFCPRFRAGVRFGIGFMDVSDRIMGTETTYE